MPAANYQSDFFVTMRDRFRAALDGDAIDRDAAEDDVRMATEDQWEADKRKARGKRPTLTENVLGPSIAQVCNDGRQNNPSIKCSPRNGGTPETAEYWQGRIRQVEYECDADIAYDTSREQQVTCGRGFYRVSTKYKSGNSGEQTVCIDPIENQFSVLWDPSARRYDLDDADWWFVITTGSRDEFERKFGKNTVAGTNSFFATADNPAPDWIGAHGAEMVQWGDYYVKQYDEDGNCTGVKCYVTNGVETNLGDGDTEWIGTTVPIIVVWGKQLSVKGVKRSFSLIRFAKDPQRLVNLYVSNIAEQIAMMPKTPYIGAKGQFLGNEKAWQNQGDPDAFREYNIKEVGGVSVGPPVRQTNEPPIQALVEGYLRAKDAVKACTGIFDSSLGANKDDTSGVAIQKRQKESDVTNFHFSDNEGRSRKRLGRILLEILPTIDGEEPAEKAVRGFDGKVKNVWINQAYTDDKTGKTVMHDMSKAAHIENEIAVSSGPSYTSQRAEENQKQGAMIQAVPELIWVIGDMYFRTSDGPGSDEMADRMERFINIKSPGLIEQRADDPKAQMQKITAQAQSLGKQNQHLTQTLNALSQRLETKQVEQEGKLAIVELQTKAAATQSELDRALKIAIAEIEAKAQTAARMSADSLALALARESNAHEVGMAAMGQVHAKQNAAAQIAAQQASGQPGPDAGPDAAPASSEPAPTPSAPQGPDEPDQQ